MRSIILAGAAILALGSVNVTAANAGGLWVAGGVTLGCGIGAIFAPGPQYNCGGNYIAGQQHGNDENGQKLKQKNGGKLWLPSYGLHQVNIGVNAINKGDDNKQKVDQSNYVKGGVWGVLQLNVGANVVEHGDDNKQKVEQSNYAKYSADTYQVNAGLNLVNHGDDNTQKIEQSNSARETEDVVQVNIGANYVGHGDDNYQSIEQSNSLSGYNDFSMSSGTVE